MASAIDFTIVRGIIKGANVHFTRCSELFDEESMHVVNHSHMVMKMLMADQSAVCGYICFSLLYFISAC